MQLVVKPKRNGTDVARALQTRLGRLKLAFARRLLGVPPTCNEGLLSLLLPIETIHPETPQLVARAIEWLRIASTTDLTSVSRRMHTSPKYPDIWPGEHYCMLSAIIQQMQPASIVEIGTFRGLSALCMLPYLPASAQLVTFDIMPWSDISGTYLTTEDFADGRLRQLQADLSSQNMFHQYSDLLSGADIIFVDGPKDGIFETTFLRLLSTLTFKSSALLIIDDIRFWNMVANWQAVQSAKLDLTSFGHWSGTGVAVLEKGFFCGETL